jgi:hypothetical protein
MRATCELKSPLVDVNCSNADRSAADAAANSWVAEARLDSSALLMAALA